MKKIILSLFSLHFLIFLYSKTNKHPNILFVFTDDHAPHAIGAYNGWLKSVNPTPVIDTLAKEGMVFVNSFCTNSIWVLAELSFKPGNIAIKMAL